ncbi:hypothetical protein C0Q90_16440 [Lacticaseibacillus paracasei]|uniref:Uncharacterized protein n=1 Tax=Lacticaseibacillus paracasei TaxID=1597 RepID=A0AB36X6U8_LACPA|nr:hypothetical protein C0Q90_16440 [Lacticaseibacillus paracasei]
MIRRPPRATRAAAAAAAEGEKRQAGNRNRPTTGTRRTGHGTGARGSAAARAGGTNGFTSRGKGGGGTKKSFRKR